MRRDSARRAAAAGAGESADLSPGSEAIIRKALEKDRNLRYQHASDLRSDLQRLKRDSETGRYSTSSLSASQSSSKIAPPTTAVATTKRWPLVAAVVAVVLIAAIGGGLYYRSHRAPRLTDKDTIVIADFANSTGDPVFDDTLKTALAVALKQSPFLNVLSDNRVAATLRLMTKPPGTKLTPEVAREVCQRAGSKAYIAGSIASARQPVRDRAEGSKLPERRHRWRSSRRAPTARPTC